MNLSSQEVKKLVEFQDFPCISLYLPTHLTSPDTMEGPIRLKNLYAEAKKKLIEISPDMLDKMSEQLGRVNDMLNDVPFWQFQNHGLAIFMSPSFFEFHKLPISFEELCYVGDTFNIKPLAELFSEQKHAYILAVNRKEVHLYEVNGEEIEERQLRRTIKSIEELTVFDDSEKHIQRHSMPMGKSTGDGSVFHGQGTVGDDKEEKKRAAEFIKRVIEGIESELHADNTPLVLVGDEFVSHTMYNSHPRFNLYPRHVDENPHHMSGAEIFERARPILQEMENARVDKAVRQYRNLTSQKKATAKSEEVIKAAYLGKVDTLLIDTHEYLWGNYDSDSQQVKIDKDRELDDEDLTNQSVLHTLMHNGKVYPVSKTEIEDQAPLAAILRY